MGNIGSQSFETEKVTIVLKQVEAALADMLKAQPVSQAGLPVLSWV